MPRSLAHATIEPVNVQRADGDADADLDEVDRPARRRVDALAAGER